MDREDKKVLILITYSFAMFFFVIRFEFVWAVLQSMKTVCMPFLIGMGIAFVLNKPTVYFQKIFCLLLGNKKMAKGISILLSYIIFLVGFFVIIMFLVPEMIRNISTFVNNLGGYLNGFENFLNGISTKYHLNIFNSNQIFAEINNVIGNVATMLLQYLGKIAPQLVLFTTNIFSAIFQILITLVISVYMLVGKERLIYQGCCVTDAFFSKKMAKKIKKLTYLCAVHFGNFVLGQIIEACILWALCFIGMQLLRFDYALLISTLIAILALIPIIGAWVGGGVAFLLLLFISPVKALFFILFFIILQQIEGNFIYPRVVGRSIGLPGIWVVVAVTVGGGLFGIIGALLGVPIMSVIYELIHDYVNEKKTSEKR